MSFVINQPVTEAKEIRPGVWMLKLECGHCTIAGPHVSAPTTGKCGLCPVGGITARRKPKF